MHRMLGALDCCDHGHNRIRRNASSPAETAAARLVEPPAARLAEPAGRLAAAPAILLLVPLVALAVGHLHPQ
jgi:hypothetical protein